MALVDSIVVFAVSLVIGALGIHLGARTIVAESDLEEAVITALLGAIVWTVVGAFLGWIPFLGPALTFLAWLGLINSRYPGNWVNAGGIALVAWISVLGILYILAVLGVGDLGAIGVPGV